MDEQVKMVINLVDDGKSIFGDIDIDESVKTADQLECLLAYLAICSVDLAMRFAGKHRTKTLFDSVLRKKMEDKLEGCRDVDQFLKSFRERPDAFPEK